MSTNPPPIGDLLRAGLSLPGLAVNPLRDARPGPQIGDGRPVVVIPGLTSGDCSTALMRATLSERGFRAEGWRLGLNLGANPGKLAALEERVRALHGRTGTPVILIGWSMGGLYARVLAQRIPHMLAMVITIAAPFSGDRRANRAWRFYEFINDHPVDNPPFDDDPSIKPKVPTVAIWSPVDGVVAPECARGTADERDLAVEVNAPHFALGSTPDCIEEVIAAIAKADTLV